MVRVVLGSGSQHSRCALRFGLFFDLHLGYFGLSCGLGSGKASNLGGPSTPCASDSTQRIYVCSKGNGLIKLDQVHGSKADVAQM